MQPQVFNNNNGNTPRPNAGASMLWALLPSLTWQHFNVLVVVVVVLVVVPVVVVAELVCWDGGE